MERTEIDAMRHIPLADFLARLGHEPVRRSGNELWYRAPYRNERTPSFRVNVAKQLWYDFGTGKGGDIFTLAGEFIEGRYREILKNSLDEILAEKLPNMKSCLEAKLFGIGLEAYI